MAAPIVSTTAIDTKPIMNSTVTPIDLEDGPLFPASLISPEVISVLPTDYTIRPILRSDFHRGYLDVLRVLTTVGEISEEAWNKRFDWIRSRNDEYYLLVVCDGEDRVVGTGSLIVERKFIHSLGMVGHIEDIAVEKNQQGKKLGLRIIQALDYVAAQVGCYKVRLLSPDLNLDFEFVLNCSQSILDCSEANEGFYVKCGFKRAGLEMAHYY
jgi:glucosamine-phosphate N-acetyltransferase